MTDPDPLWEHLHAARPVLPAGLRNRALDAGREAWTPWWRRLSTWAVAAAAMLAIDVVAAIASAPESRFQAPPVVLHAFADDPDLEALISRQRDLALTWRGSRMATAGDRLAWPSIMDVNKEDPL